MKYFGVLKMSIDNDLHSADWADFAFGQKAGLNVLRSNKCASAYTLQCYMIKVIYVEVPVLQNRLKLCYYRSAHKKTFPKT